MVIDYIILHQTELKTNVIIIDSVAIKSYYGYTYKLL